MADALRALGALSQATRLKAPAATMSFHLGQLTRAELVTARREGRSIIYFARLERMRALLEILTEDCCQGRPEICAPVMLGLAEPGEGIDGRDTA